MVKGGTIKVSPFLLQKGIEMSPSEIDLAATKIEEYLRSRGAVRISETEIADFVTVEQICDDLRLCDTDFRRIKARMVQSGIAISYISNRGHFIGWKGEGITNTVMRYKVSVAYARKVRGYAEELENVSSEEKFWIDRRFKDFSVDPKEVAEYVNRFEQAHQ